MEKYLRRNDEVHRADAYLASDSQNIVIEVQSSHIDIEDVQKRNAFYTINGKCLWILNTAKHFASGEISVTWSAQQQQVIETTSTLIHNVVHGRNTANVFICLQKNENAFVFIQAAYKNYCIDGLYGYRVSQTYTWDELVEMITQDSLPQYSLSLEEQNFISIPRKIKQQMSAYTEKRYYPQYDDARKAKTVQQLLKVLRTYPVDDTLCSIAMNHHCLAGEQHHEDYETVVMYLIEIS